MWVPGIELWPSGLVTSTLTYSSLLSHLAGFQVLFRFTAISYWAPCVYPAYVEGALGILFFPCVPLSKRWSLTFSTSFLWSCGGGEIGPELSWWVLGVLPLCLWNSTVVYPSFLSSCQVHLAWDPGGNKGQRNVNFHKNLETAGRRGGDDDRA